MATITRDSELTVLQQCDLDPRFDDLFAMKQELEEYLEGVSDIHTDPDDPAISFEVQLLKDFPAILAAREFIDRSRELTPQYKDPRMLRLAQMALIAKVSLVFNTLIYKVEHYARVYDSDFKGLTN